MVPYVEFRGVYKSFGTQTVLSDLNLVIPQGKITYIVGRSGEGKSVTLKHIVGILQPDRGEIWVGGTRVDTLGPCERGALRRKIGFLFQDGALFDSLPVWENVAFPLVQSGLWDSLGARDLGDRVQRSLDLVGLGSTSPGAFPQELSIGEKKRVGLARALVVEPELLLYDEPTTSMDPEVAQWIDGLTAQLGKDSPGLTSLVVSHDIESCAQVADRIVLLHGGRVYAEGTRDEVLSSKDPLVQQFFSGSAEGPLTQPPSVP